MNLRVGMILIALVSTCALALSVFAYRSATREEPSADALRAIEGLLVERESVMRELQQPRFSEGSSTPLAAYLIRLRRDGAAGSSEMRQRLDQLAENTIALATLLNLTATQSRSLAFRTEVDRFRTYSAAWLDRWKSVNELFMAGGSLPASEIPFPTTLPAMVQRELSTTL